MSDIKMENVREYAEEFDVELSVLSDADNNDESVIGREIIVAKNQGGFDCTMIDLLDLVGWLKSNLQNF